MDRINAVFDTADALAERNFSDDEFEKIRLLVRSNYPRLLEAQELVAREIIAQEPPSTPDPVVLTSTRNLSDPRIMFVIFDPETREPGIFTTALSGENIMMLNENFLQPGRVGGEGLEKLLNFTMKLKTQQGK